LSFSKKEAMDSRLRGNDDSERSQHKPATLVSLFINPIVLTLLEPLPY